MEPAVLSQVSVEREGGWKKQHTTVFYLLHVYYFVVFLYKFLRVCVCRGKHVEIRTTLWSRL